MQPQEEFAIEIDKGKTLLVSYSATSEPDEEGMVTVYFELNGQPRPVRVADRSRKPHEEARPKADPPTRPSRLADAGAGGFIGCQAGAKGRKRRRDPQSRGHEDADECRG